ncbi:MAG: iron-sulfur cluster assembly accessory protein [Flavobacteriales bacterium]|jgi:iron-sulfur cluster assembly protein|nr:iron-sulfur cluster assembly accessory protein [Flavobacteriales bacterium]|tara:strand:- start:217 stop:540 length:324 start_codon:yes stop_codon:yes gene_type:complete
MITVSDNAKKKLISLMGEQPKKKHFVRVGVASGGCSGLSYNLDFDSKMLETDKLFEHNDIKLLVDKKSYLYLIGTTLNYSGGLNGKGFVFENPNASRTCGCGESFAV